MRAAARSGSTADAEITLEANPETVTTPHAGTIPRRRCQSSELRRPVVPRRRAEAARAAAFGRARRAGGRDGARGRVRQRQHRPDDVAAGAGRGAVARVGGRRRSRVNAGSPVALHPRGVSASPAQAGDRSPRLDAGSPMTRRPRCTSRRWRGSTPPATSSTKSRTCAGRAANRATT